VSGQLHVPAALPPSRSVPHGEMKILDLNGTRTQTPRSSSSYTERLTSAPRKKSKEFNHILLHYTVQITTDNIYSTASTEHYFQQVALLSKAIYIYRQMIAIFRSYLSCLSSSQIHCKTRTSRRILQYPWTTAYRRRKLQR
jgi:hypothetical protein